MIPYIGSEIIDALRHRSRTLPWPPAISSDPPHFDISAESDFVSFPVRREEALRFQQNFTIVSRSTTARAITLALYLLSR
jgi:hypothetical protein